MCVRTHFIKTFNQNVVFIWSCRCCVFSHFIISTILFQTIHALQYSRFKKALLGSVSDDGALNIWDTNTKKTIVSFPDEHTAPAMDLSFSPMNDMLLATVGLDKKIVFYDILGKK